MATKQTKTPEENSAKAAKTSAKTEAKAARKTELPADPEQSRARVAATGRNDACPCGSGKKYKKCHLPADEQAAAPAPVAPDAQQLLTDGWRLFEQRRPGAAEKEFRAALAIDPKLEDAHVGIGMARLAAGNADGAKEELGIVLAGGEAAAEKMKADGVKDAFSKPEAQPFIRAAHALGCLAYDEDRFEDAVKDLARVHAIDDGSVGIEARLIAAKALMKLERAADAVALLEPATKLEEGKGRAELGLALARFVAGDEAKAREALDVALDANPNHGKTLLGRIRRRVENVAGARPGSLEEALLYAQTYGDVWTDPAKKFLEKVLDERASKKASARAESEPAEEATPPA
ncbi:MAG TPA: tetratricopeptide repeat protein [Polyangia bacterium]|nr:tetratricopeptide repeat protein [Polyangia bacterium]